MDNSQACNPPPTHLQTDTIKQRKGKNNTLECIEIDQILRISDHKNVNKSKNYCSQVKLESKKQDKKIMASGER